MVRQLFIVLYIFFLGFQFGFSQEVEYNWIRPTCVTAPVGPNGAVVLTITGHSSDKEYFLLNTFTNQLTTSGVTSENTHTFGSLSPNILYMAYAMDVVSGNFISAQSTHFLTAIPFTANVQKIKDAGCASQCVGIVRANVSGGVAPYNYSWNDGVGGVYPSVSQLDDVCPLTFSVTITDDIGCVIQSTNSISIVPVDVIANTSNVQHVICKGQPQGSASVSATLTTGAVTYTWSNGHTGTQNPNIYAGNHYVVAVDEINCRDTAFFSITEPDDKLIIDIDNLVHVRCKGMNIGEAHLVTSFGEPPLSISWSDGGTGVSRTDLPALYYEVIVSDDLGCKDTVDFTITEPLIGVEGVILAFEQPSCFGYQDGFAEISVSGGLAPYRVEWDDIDNDSTYTDFIRNDLEKNVYTITVFDSEDCENFVVLDMPEPDILTAQIVAPDDSPAQTRVLCYGDCNIPVKVTATGGTIPYVSYEWDNGIPDGSTANLCANTYTVIVTDNKGCKASDIHEITTPDTLVATPSIITSIPCFNGEGIAGVTVIGGTQPYEYTWSNGSVTANTGLVPSDTYSVIVRDVNACVANADTVLTQPSLLEVSITIDNILCQDVSVGTITAHPTGGTVEHAYIYEWSSGQATSTIGNLTTQPYSVIVYDDNSCIAHDTIDLTNINEFGVLFLPTLVTCEGRSDGEIIASAHIGNPPFTYLWSDGETDSARTNLTEGWYILTITDNLGCEATDSIYLGAIPAPFLVLFGTTETPCNESEGSAYVVMSGGTAPYTYLWSNLETTDSIGNLAYGWYNVLVTDDNGCTYTRDFFVDDTSSLSVSISSPDTRIRCIGGSTGTATAIPTLGTAPYTFEWSTTETTETISNLTAGIYHVIVYDAYLCQAFDTIEFYEFNVLQSTIIDSAMVRCNGNDDGFARVEIEGGITPYSLLWSNGATSYINNNLGPDTYTVTITDNAGCVSQNTITITEPSALQATITEISGISCGGKCDGEAQISVSGGITPYIYNWSSGDCCFLPKNLCGGMNYITVTDANNCVLTDSVMVVDTIPRIGLTAFEINPDCGTPNGELAIIPFGGIAPHSFLWSNGGTDSLIQNVLADVYVLTVTDAAGCFLDTLLILDDNSTMTIGFERQQITFCDPCNESFIAQVDLATPPYQYLWQHGKTTALADSLCPGTYSVTVTDANLCRRSALLEVLPVALDVTVLQKHNIQCFGDSTGIIEVVASGGVSSNYTYIWSNGETGPLAQQVPAGNLQLIVSEDLSVCTRTYNYTFTQAPQLQTFFITDQASYCEDSTGIMHVELLGGTPPFNYEWETGVIGNTISNAWPEYIYITIEDGNNCIVIDSGKVDNISDFSLFELDRYAISCIGDSDGALEVGMINGYSPFSFEWSHDVATVTQRAEGLSAGTYTIIVTDDRNCAVQFEFPELVNPEPIQISFIETQAIVCADATGKLSALTTGGHAPYLYEWTYNTHPLSQTGNMVSNGAAGLYSVFARDARNCISDTISYQFNNPAPIVAEFSVEITGCGSISHTGSIVVDTIYGHNPPYRFRWHDETTTTTWYDGVTNLERTMLAAGEYFFTVFDSLGLCYEVFRNNTFPIQVTEINTTVEHTHCAFYTSEELTANKPDGSIQINEIRTQEGSFSSFENFSFSWEQKEDETNPSIQHLVAGDYYVNIQTTNECITRVFAGTILPRVSLQPSIISAKTTASTREKICFGDSLELRAITQESFIDGYSPASTAKTYIWSSFAQNTNASISRPSYERTWVSPETKSNSDSSGVRMYYTLDACTSPFATFSISHFNAIDFRLQVRNNLDILYGDSVSVMLLDAITIEPTVEPWFVFKNPDEDGFISIEWESQNMSRSGKGQIEETLTNETTYLNSGNYGIEFSALISGYYKATGRTTNQCIESHEVFVHVRDEIFVPSGITPNGDGDNDVWIIPYLYSCPDAIVRIFNRWGVKVYENTDIYYKNPWDGRNKKGELLPLGTYYYIIEYNDDKETPPRAGSITILY